MTVGDNRFASLGINPDEVFLLNPRNVKFLNGLVSAPEFQPTRVSIYGTLFVAFLVMLPPFGFLPVVLCGVVPALLFFLPGAAAVASMAFLQWKERTGRIAAWQTSSIVAGQVVACKGWTGGTWWYEVELTYQFLNPLTGQSVTATDRQKRGHIGKKGGPPAGTPVIVVAYHEPIANPWRTVNPWLRNELSEGFVL